MDDGLGTAVSRFFDNQPEFDSVARCNIYLNQAVTGKDLYLADDYYTIDILVDINLSIARGQAVACSPPSSHQAPPSATGDPSLDRVDLLGRKWITFRRHPLVMEYARARQDGRRQN